MNNQQLHYILTVLWGIDVTSSEQLVDLLAKNAIQRFKKDIHAYFGVTLDNISTYEHLLTKLPFSNKVNIDREYIGNPEDLEGD